MRKQAAGMQFSLLLQSHARAPQRRHLTASSLQRRCESAREEVIKHTKARLSASFPPTHTKSQTPTIDQPLRRTKLILVIGYTIHKMYGVATWMDGWYTSNQIVEGQINIPSDWRYLIRLIQQQNHWFHQLRKARPRPWDSKASPHHHSTTTMFHFWLFSPQEVIPKSVGHQGVFLSNARQVFMFHFPGATRLPVGFLMMESWKQTLGEVSETRSPSDVRLVCLVTSWMSRPCVPWRNAGRPTTSGKIHYCSESPPPPPLEIIALAVVCWSPRVLEVAF